MAVPNTFTNGTVADADQVNANFSWTGLVPIGAVVAWLKSLTNCPALDDRFVECNGQTLSDADSVFNGVVIPNLNGASSSTQRFLRGSTTSGSVGGEDSHTHLASGGGGNFESGADYSISPSGTLPSYYEVVYIMRVK